MSSCYGSEPDPDPADAGMMIADKISSRFGNHIDRQEHEGRGDQLLRAALTAVRGRALPGHQPQDDQTGSGLNQAVRTEANERDRARDRAGADSEACLEEMPDEAETSEHPDAANESALACALRSASDARSHYRQWRSSGHPETLASRNQELEDRELQSASASSLPPASISVTLGIRISTQIE